MSNGLFFLIIGLLLNGIYWIVVYLLLEFRRKQEKSK